VTAQHTITPGVACHSLAAYLVASMPGLDIGATVFGLGAISACSSHVLAWHMLTAHMVDAERRLGSHVTTAALEYARRQS
jgi:hypothetical protein